MNHNETVRGSHYDEEGNVILDIFEPFAEPKKTVSSVQRIETEESAKETQNDRTSHRDKHKISEALLQGKEQLLATQAGAKEELLQIQAEAASFIRTVARAPKFIASILSAKVTYGEKPKPRSRGTLFIIDSMRFGVTFAAIFIGLFVAINYQSFWHIAKAELALEKDLHTAEALATLTGAPQGTGASGTLYETGSDGNLLSFLPPVGPPENRLVIPKIGKNIPIVIPPMDSLISEDWIQFEKDIQESLREGVVHYPGTARPGQAGNFFVTGHSSYYPWDSGKYKDVFSRLGELEVGDTYSVYYGGDLHTYRVSEKKEVKPTNVAVLDQPTDKRISTLMTCTPIGTTLRRLVLHAQEIDPVTGVPLKVGEHHVEPLNTPKVNALPI